MRQFIFAFGWTGLGAAPALAHPGHLGTLAGHDHWVAGAAIAAAILIGLWGALKGRNAPAENADAEPEDTGTETPS